MVDRLALPAVPQCPVISLAPTPSLQNLPPNLNSECLQAPLPAQWPIILARHLQSSNPNHWEEHWMSNRGLPLARVQLSVTAAIAGCLRWRLRLHQSLPKDYQVLGRYCARSCLANLAIRALKRIVTTQDQRNGISPTWEIVKEKRKEKEVKFNQGAGTWVGFGAADFSKWGATVLYKEIGLGNAWSV